MKKLLPLELKFIAAMVFALISIHAKAQLADGKCKFLGNITAGTNTPPSDYLTYWNQVTPENGGKWGTVEGTKDDMRWAEVENAYNFAKANDLPFKQHTFVWGQQQPSWIAGLSPADQKAQVEEWIQSYCTKFPDTDMIDVVNEPLHAVPSYAAALGGGGATGWDWVIWSFETARKHCPNAKLLLNDYNILKDNSATTTYLNIVNLLKGKNLIDGIGEQGHFFERTPIATLKANLDKFHQTGLPIYISEYDVNIDAVTGVLNEAEQKSKYEEQITMFWKHPGVQGITLWGYKQAAIWQANAYLIRSDLTKRPAMEWLVSYIPSAQGGNFCLPPVNTEADADTDFKVYPNPANQGKFTVHLAEAGVFNLDMLDYKGQVVYQSEIKGGAPVEIKPEVSPGFFILKIHNKTTTVFKKVAIN